MTIDVSAFRVAETLSAPQPLPNGVRFTTEIGPLTVTLHAQGILRLRLGESDLPDYGLLAEPAGDGTEAMVMEVPDGYRVAGGGVVIDFTVNPVRFRLYRTHDLVATSISDEHFRGWTRLPAIARGPDHWLVSFALQGSEAIYGLGERFSTLNARGQLINSRNEDALGVNTEHAYKNIPFAFSPKGWGVLAHSPATVISGVGHPQWSNRSLVMLVEDAAADLFLFVGQDPAALLERLTWLTGRPQRPPDWSLGVWLSRAYYRTPAEALQAAQEIRAHRIPCDVITFDGRAWQDTPTRFLFEWDPSRFDDPKASVQALKDLGFKVCNWEYPYVSINNPHFGELADKGYFLKDAKTGAPYQYHWDPGPFGQVLTPLPTSGLLDFTNPEAYAFWRDQHKALFDIGVDVMKVDFGEQIPDEVVAFNGDGGRRLHSVYALLYNRCVYEATEQHYDGEPMVWARSGWIGSQRYPVQWGGDPQSDWGGLVGSIRGGLNWGLSGVPYYASDVGGFYGAQQPDPELYIRWTQAAIYGSHFRFHGIGVREPWGFGQEALGICRQTLEWRYRLIPYLAQAMDRAAATGLPVMRAMVLAFPKDPAAWAFDLQFMCGPDLLVCPVTEPEAMTGGHLTVYLPAGERWVDLATGTVQDGGQVLTVTCPLDRIPVYGRVGGVLPLGPVVQHTGELPGGRATIVEQWRFAATGIEKSAG